MLFMNIIPVCSSRRMLSGFSMQCTIIPLRQAERRSEVEGSYGGSLLRARWQTDTRGQYSKHFHKSSGFHSMCLYLPLTEHACCSSKAVFVHWVVLNSFLKQSMHQFMHRAVSHHSSAFACASHMMCDIWGGTHFAAPAVRPLWPLWLGDK